jgi:transcriptional regulator with XRE-family HTH domain
MTTRLDDGSGSPQGACGNRAVIARAHARAVRDVQVGRAVRALRQRRGLSQQRLGELAGLSQATVSLVERGRFDRLSLRAVRALLEALDASAELDVRWRRGELDRLVDRRHAAVVEAAVRWLREAGWLVEVEVSYAAYSERGSIDVLAFDARSVTLLVVEVKSELTAVEATVRKLDEKIRHAPAIAAERFGWRASSVARLLVLPETTTSRRRVHDHAATFATAFPMRAAALRRWLRDPSRGGIGRGGVLFLPLTNRGSDWRARRGSVGAGAGGRGGAVHGSGAIPARREPAVGVREPASPPFIARGAIWRDSRPNGAE